MRVIFPPIPMSFKEDQVAYLRDLSTSLIRFFGQCVTRNTPVDQLLLTSPSKKIYKVTVADDGTLSTTLVQE